MNELFISQIRIANLAENTHDETEATGDNANDADRHLIMKYQRRDGEKDKSNVNVQRHENEKSQNSHQNPAEEKAEAFPGPILPAPTVQGRKDGDDRDERQDAEQRQEALDHFPDGKSFRFLVSGENLSLPAFPKALVEKETHSVGQTAIDS